MVSWLKRVLARDGGFTLVEVVVVVIILAIISSIAIFGLTGAQRTSLRKACEADWRNAQLGATAYLTDNPSSAAMPGNITDLSVANTLSSGGYKSLLTSSDKYKIGLTFSVSGSTWTWSTAVTPAGGTAIADATISACNSLS